MKLGSLFDGIGGALLCAKWSGIEPVWASEIEPFPIKVTEHHFPEVKHLGDITKINGAEIEPVDIIVGGSPCQDLSVAGKRAGLAGERSGLFMEQIRIIKEMRSATDRPRYMVWENVPGAFSSNNGEDFRAVLEETARVADPTVSIPRPVTGWANAGSILGNNFTISWRTFDAQYWGVPQRRRRIYLVADFGGQSAPEILFESESVPGNFTESRSKGQGTAEDAERSSGNAICFEPRSQDGVPRISSDGLSPTLNTAQGGQRQPCVVTAISQLKQVRRLTVKECERLQGYPSIMEGNKEMTKDEFIAFCLASGQIITNPETGEIYTTKGPGGMALKKPKLLIGSDINGYTAHKIVSGDVRHMCRSHRIVWIDSYGIIPDGKVIDHINGNKKDNRLSNLQLLTPSENSTKARKDGAYLVGDEHPHVKVLEWQKLEMLSEYNKGKITMQKLGEKYGITKGRVSQIFREMGYTNIPGASDSARYKALGNSFAIPNAYFVISNISNYKDALHGA